MQLINIGTPVGGGGSDPANQPSIGPSANYPNGNVLQIWGTDTSSGAVVLDDTFGIFLFKPKTKIKINGLCAYLRVGTNTGTRFALYEHPEGAITNMADFAKVAETDENLDSSSGTHLMDLDGLSDYELDPAKTYALGAVTDANNIWSGTDQNSWEAVSHCIPVKIPLQNSMTGGIVYDNDTTNKLYRTLSYSTLTEMPDTLAGSWNTHGFSSASTRNINVALRVATLGTS